MTHYEYINKLRKSKDQATAIHAQLRFMAFVLKINLYSDTALRWTRGKLNQGDCCELQRVSATIANLLTWRTNEER